MEDGQSLLDVIDDSSELFHDGASNGFSWADDFISSAEENLLEGNSHHVSQQGNLTASAISANSQQNIVLSQPGVATQIVQQGNQQFILKTANGGQIQLSAQPQVQFQQPIIQQSSRLATTSQTQFQVPVTSASQIQSHTPSQSPAPSASPLIGQSVTSNSAGISNLFSTPSSSHTVSHLKSTSPAPNVNIVHLPNSLQQQQLPQQQIQLAGTVPLQGTVLQMAPGGGAQNIVNTGLISGQIQGQPALVPNHAQSIVNTPNTVIQNPNIVNVNVATHVLYNNQQQLQTQQRAANAGGIQAIQGGLQNPFNIQGTLIQTAEGKSILIPSQQIAQPVNIQNLGQLPGQLSVQPQITMSGQQQQSTNTSLGNVIRLAPQASSTDKPSTGDILAGLSQFLQLNQQGQQVLIQRTPTPGQPQNIILRTVTPSNVIQLQQPGGHATGQAMQTVGQVPQQTLTSQQQGIAQIIPSSQSAQLKFVSSQASTVTSGQPGNMPVTFQLAGQNVNLQQLTGLNTGQVGGLQNVQFVPQSQQPLQTAQVQLQNVQPQQLQQVQQQQVASKVPATVRRSSSQGASNVPLPSSFSQRSKSPGSAGVIEPAQSGQTLGIIPSITGSISETGAQASHPNMQTISTYNMMAKQSAAAQAAENMKRVVTGSERPASTNPLQMANALQNIQSHASLKLGSSSGYSTAQSTPVTTTLSHATTHTVQLTVANSGQIVTPSVQGSASSSQIMTPVSSKLQTTIGAASNQTPVVEAKNNAPTLKTIHLSPESQQQLLRVQFEIKKINAQQNLPPDQKMQKLQTLLSAQKQILMKGRVVATTQAQPHALQQQLQAQQAASQKLLGAVSSHTAQGQSSTSLQQLGTQGNVKLQVVGTSSTGSTQEASSQPVFTSPVQNQGQINPILNPIQSSTHQLTNQPCLTTVLLSSIPSSSISSSSSAAGAQPQTILTGSLPSTVLSLQQEQTSQSQQQQQNHVRMLQNGGNLPLIATATGQDTTPSGSSDISNPQSLSALLVKSANKTSTPALNVGPDVTATTISSTPHTVPTVTTSSAMVVVSPSKDAVPKVVYPQQAPGAAKPSMTGPNPLAVPTQIKIANKILTLSLTPAQKEKVENCLSRMTPEQQQMYLQSQQQVLNKIQKQQQIQAQIQAQVAAQKSKQQQGNSAPSTKQLLMVTSGKIPLTVQQPESQAKPTEIQVTQNPQLKESPTRGLKRTLEIPKGSLIHQQIRKDQMNAVNPDVQRPFKTRGEACRRLLRYHVFQSHGPKQEEFDKVDAQFEEIAGDLMKKKARLEDRLRILLLEESLRTDPSAELVMMQRMQNQDLKKTIEEEKTLVRDNPDAFEPMPMKLLKKEPVESEEEVEEKPQNLIPEDEIKKEVESDNSDASYQNGTVVKSEPADDIGYEQVPQKAVDKKVKKLVIKSDGMNFSSSFKSESSSFGSEEQMYRQESDDSFVHRQESDDSYVQMEEEVSIENEEVVIENDGHIGQYVEQVEVKNEPLEEEIVTELSGDEMVSVSAEGDASTVSVTVPFYANGVQDSGFNNPDEESGLFSSAGEASNPLVREESFTEMLKGDEGTSQESVDEVELKSIDDGAIFESSHHHVGRSDAMVSGGVLERQLSRTLVQNSVFGINSESVDFDEDNSLSEFNNDGSMEFADDSMYFNNTPSQSVLTSSVETSRQLSQEFSNISSSQDDEMEQNNSPFSGGNVEIENAVGSIIDYDDSGSKMGSAGHVYQPITESLTDSEENSYYSADNSADQSSVLMDDADADRQNESVQWEDDNMQLASQHDSVKAQTESAINSILDGGTSSLFGYGQSADLFSSHHNQSNDLYTGHHTYKIEPISDSQSEHRTEADDSGSDVHVHITDDDNSQTSTLDDDLDAAIQSIL